MKTRLSLAALVLLAASSAHAATITDTFTRLDGDIVRNSLGDTETGGYTYVERHNFASNNATNIPNGTAEIRDNKLIITGQDPAGQTPAGSPAGSKNATGGAYLPTDFADVRLGLDLSFNLSAGSNGPSGPGGVNEDEHNVATNQFNNTFLMVLRSGLNGNFGANAGIDDGSVGIELVPNGTLQVRQQLTGPPNSLPNVYFGNPLNSNSQSRWPLLDDFKQSLLPTHFGNGTFDLNGNGWLDADEVIHFEAEIIDNSLKVFVNGLQYGPNMTLQRLSAPIGALNGIGLHKNRIGGSADRVGTDPVIDNLTITSIPEPSTLLLVGLSAMFLANARKKS
jgi:hypothetical protein